MQLDSIKEKTRRLKEDPINARIRQLKSELEKLSGDREASIIAVLRDVGKYAEECGLQRIAEDIESMFGYRYEDDYDHWSDD